MLGNVFTLQSFWYSLALLHSCIKLLICTLRTVDGLDLLSNPKANFCKSSEWVVLHWHDTVSTWQFKCYLGNSVFDLARFHKIPVYMIYTYRYMMLSGKVPFEGDCGENCGWEQGKHCDQCQSLLLGKIQAGNYNFSGEVCVCVCVCVCACAHACCLRFSHILMDVWNNTIYLSYMPQVHRHTWSYNTLIEQSF